MHLPSHKWHTNCHTSSIIAPNIPALRMQLPHFVQPLCILGFGSDKKTKIKKIPSAHPPTRRAHSLTQSITAETQDSKYNIESRLPSLRQTRESHNQPTTNHGTHGTTKSQSTHNSKSQFHQLIDYSDNNIPSSHPTRLDIHQKNSHSLNHTNSD